MTKQKTKIYWLEIYEKTVAIWKPYQQFNYTDTNHDGTKYYHFHLNGPDFSEIEMIKSVSCFQIGDTIARECPECHGGGKHILCNGTGQIQYKLKSVELKQAIDIIVDNNSFRVSDYIENSISSDTWLCVGEVE